MFDRPDYCFFKTFCFTNRALYVSYFLQVPEIDELERSMHALLKNRASVVVQRRQMDVSDQAGDFLNAQAGNYNFLFMQLKWNWLCTSL